MLAQKGLLGYFNIAFHCNPNPNRNRNNNTLGHAAFDPDFDSDFDPDEIESKQIRMRDGQSPSPDFYDRGLESRCLL
jgi:hypothetical protein